MEKTDLINSSEIPVIQKHLQEQGYLIKDFPRENDPYYTEVKEYLMENIFNICDENNNPYHRYTWNRFIWLYRWLGEKCIEEIKNNKFSKLVDNLKKIWKEKTFNPFISISMAEKNVLENNNTIYIRFSRTIPNDITITYYNISKDGGYVLNSRHNVSEDCKIYFGKYYDFDDFVLHVQLHVFNTANHIVYPVEYLFE